MADHLSALVVRCVRGFGATIAQALHHTRSFPRVLFRDGDRSLLCVELGVTLTAPCIPERTSRPRLVQQTQLPPGIDAVRRQRLTVQAVDRGQVRLRRRAPQTRVPGLDQAPRRVETLPGNARINLRAVGMAAITHATNRQGTRVDDRQRRCRGVVMSVHGIGGPSL
ncbi:hypothetical protein D3C86_1445460 [compost metagenome]